MAIVIVNGQELELDDQQSLNGIEVARIADVEIPHYCWHPGLSVVASCRMCLVETGRRDPKTGEISMLPKLVPACQTPATDGTVFVTESEKVKAARAMVEEDLLIRHPIDCPICDKAGECLLQDYHFEHGQAERRADLRPFTSRRRDLGSTITLFVDRCVMCSRCVRFTREISGTNELMVINRGSHEEIDVFPGFPLENKLSGNVADICPVGALGDSDFLYTQRVWFMKKHVNVCAGCSTGCSIFVEDNQDHIYRLKPRENRYINQWWMCDEGRYGFKHVHSANRNTQPKKNVDGQLVNIEWSPMIDSLDASLRTAGHIAAVVSPHLTVEEAYLLCRYARQIDDRAILVLGPVPVVGQDEEFPNGFVIRNEKCPNRRGVEEILKHFGDGERITAFTDFLTQLDVPALDAIWISGGYKAEWNEQSAADALSIIPRIVVQDAFPSPIWNSATYQLPGATFAERAGSYVNHANRLQSFNWAIRPPAGVMLEGHVLWRLLGRQGFFNAHQTIHEIAQAIPFFARAGGVVPDTGIALDVNQLVEA